MPQCHFCLTKVHMHMESNAVFIAVGSWKIVQKCVTKAAVPIALRAGNTCFLTSVRPVFIVYQIRGQSLDRHVKLHYFVHINFVATSTVAELHVMDWGHPPWSGVFGPKEEVQPGLVV